MSKIFFLYLIFVSSMAYTAVPSPVSPVLEKKLLSLQVRLSESQNRLEKFQEVKKTLKEVQEFQENRAESTLTEAGRVQLLVAILESLPRAAKFDLKNCDKYRSEYLEEFEPMADEAPQDPSVLYGWDVLDKLCR